MIERVIEVAGKQVAFKSSAAVPRLYRAKFKRDIFKDFSKLEQSYKGNATQTPPSPARLRTGLTSSICSPSTKCSRRFLKCGVRT